MMLQGVERRECRRFQIPCAEVRYKKERIIFSSGRFSRALPVLDMSKGGLAFLCNKKLRSGKTLMMQLDLPDESSLILRAWVRWQGKEWHNSDITTGVEFMPFGGRREWNSLETLDVLRELDARYGEEE